VTGSTDKTDKFLDVCRITRNYVQRSPMQEKVNKADLKLIEHLKDIAKEKDPLVILHAERAILINEKEHFSNAPIQHSSLDAAIEGLDVSVALFDMVKSIETYQPIIDTHQTRKRLKNGIPMDEAREFFKGHNGRLLNLQKSVSSDEEKKLLLVRKDNIAIARKIYIDLQEKTLGKTKAINKKNEMSL
jgi:prolyl oligopeptidase PreP (S9A serine peptidase family)